jgi:hypothetical protein
VQAEQDEPCARSSADAREEQQREGTPAASCLQGNAQGCPDTSPCVLALPQGTAMPADSVAGSRSEAGRSDMGCATAVAFCSSCAGRDVRGGAEQQGEEAQQQGLLKCCLASAEEETAGRDGP